MRKMRLLVLAAGVMAIGFVSCKKGDAGPAGPQGPAGPDSVMHSAWTPVSMSLAGVSGTDSIYSGTVTAAALSQAIIDSGLVLCYVQFQDLSITSVDNLAPFLEVSYQVGEIDLLGINFSLDGANFRYVLIAGTVTVNAQEKARIRALSYKDAVKEFGLN